MNTVRIAARNSRALWRRWLGLTLLVAVAVATCLTAFGLGDNVKQATDNGVRESVANRSLTVERDISNAESAPLSPRSVQSIAAMPGVDTVEPRAQISFGYKDATVPGVLLNATVARPSVPPPLVKTVRPNVFPLAAGEAVLPRTAEGSDLTPLLGRTIRVEITERRGNSAGVGAARTLTVVGLFDPSWQIDGPDAAYAAEPTVVEWAAADAGISPDAYRNAIGYNLITVVAKDAASVEGVLHRLQAAGYSASSMQQRLQSLPTVLELVNRVGIGLLTALGILAAIASFALSAALVRQRTGEIGVCKALGFSRSEIFRIFLLEAAMVGVVGALVGVLLGSAGAVALHSMLIDKPDLAGYLSSGVGLPGASTVAVGLATAVAVIVLGALLPARRAARLDPVTAIGRL